MAVWVGYIACFGMAVETGVVMLVYLREAITEQGGLEQIGSIAVLRQAILEGAVHRLRPKLLTEGAAIISIAPMLWATGVGAEVIRPMAARSGWLAGRRRSDRHLPACPLLRRPEGALEEDCAAPVRQEGMCVSSGPATTSGRWRPRLRYHDMIDSHPGRGKGGR